MIIKGGSRAAPRQLARHLQRGDTNERVEIIELQSPAPDLTETLRDWQTLAEGTRGTKGLYHVNIDPAEGYKMTPEQWQRSVDVLENELGLTGQPRAVVLHEKNGREHIHVVWQRTDIDTMTLLSDSQNYAAHERASMALEKEFGHELVPGKHAKRDMEQPAPKAEITHDEWQQADRTGIDPRDLKEMITRLHRQSDSAEAFKTALEDHGFILAKGDRRDYVLVDEQGEVHSLARQIKGVTAKDLRAFMTGIDPQEIPSVEQAKALQHDNATSPAETRSPAAEPPAPEPTPEPVKPPAGPSPEERAKLEAALQARHEKETRQLRDRQEAEHKQTAAAHDRTAAHKLHTFDAHQKAALETYDREHTPERGRVAAFFAAIWAWFNPAKEQEQIQQREYARSEFIREQQQERDEQVEMLNSGKQKDVAALAARHAQQQRDQAAKYNEDLARYTYEQQAASRLLAEMAEQRRQEELRQQQPPPPDRPL